MERLILSAKTGKGGNRNATILGESITGSFRKDIMRALIVDDSRFVRGFLRGLLEKLGIECEEACDGQAGLNRLQCGPSIDLALVDWNMPVMDGLEMLRQLRARYGAGIKVMMVTTEAENNFIVSALDAGADEYLMKPFDQESLTAKLALLGLGDF
jgi:two-component system chemotaxis response regulator CheY